MIFRYKDSALILRWALCKQQATKLRNTSSGLAPESSVPCDITPANGSGSSGKTIHSLNVNSESMINRCPRTAPSGSNSVSSLSSAKQFKSRTTLFVCFVSASPCLARSPDIRGSVAGTVLTGAPSSRQRRFFPPTGSRVTANRSPGRSKNRYRG